MNFIRKTCLTAALLAAGSVQAAGSLDAVFDSYCDGFAVVWDNTNVAYGTETGCASGPAVGVHGFVFYNGNGNTLALSLDHVPNAIYVIRKDHTWSIYVADGSELQSGTWSDAGANAAGGGGDTPSGNQ